MLACSHTRNNQRRGISMKKILMAIGLVTAMLSGAAMAQSANDLMFGGTVG